jgi:hypothetical protein
MATSSVILYTSLKANAGQSALIAGQSFVKIKPNGVGGTVTIKNTVGISTGDIATFLGTTVTANSLDYFFCTIPSATSTATNVITYDQIAALDSRMKTAVRGSLTSAITSGTCGTNATTTEIVLAADSSTVDDFYNGKSIACLLNGTTTYRKITDYVGSTHTITCVTTGSAVTDTSTYIIYTQPNVFILGDAVSNEKAARVAWTTLFPSANIPPMVALMGGYGTNFQPAFLFNHTATSVAAAGLTETGAFTLNQYTGKNYHVAVLTATTGAGQVKKILSNTVNALTIEPWDTLPTGTVTYSVYSSDQFALYDQYLPYAIMVYLSDLSKAQVQKDYQQLLDKLNVLPKGEYNPAFNATLLKTYGDRGKAIQDAVNAAMVTA